MLHLVKSEKPAQRKNSVTYRLAYGVFQGAVGLPAAVVDAGLTWASRKSHAKNLAIHPLLDGAERTFDNLVGRRMRGAFESYDSRNNVAQLSGNPLLSSDGPTTIGRVVGFGALCLGIGYGGYRAAFNHEAAPTPPSGALIQVDQTRCPTPPNWRTNKTGQWEMDLSAPANPTRNRHISSRATFRPDSHYDLPRGSLDPRKRASLARP